MRFRFLVERVYLFRRRTPSVGLECRLPAIEQEDNRLDFGLLAFFRMNFVSTPAPENLHPDSTVVTVNSITPRILPSDHTVSVTIPPIRLV